MADPATQYNLNPNDWKLKVKEYSRGRMKITISLSKDEAQAFTNFKNTIKPDGMNEVDFTKSIFVKGMAATDQEMMQNTIDNLRNNEELRAQLEEAGKNPDEMIDQILNARGEVLESPENTPNLEIVE